MKSTVELIQALKQILETPISKRAEFVKAFQNEIWNDESIWDEKLNEVLSELAYDLDFYEPNEKLRKESPNYYGDERLEKEMHNVLNKIKKL
ncbi:MAG: colicin immunity domain-containing protein [Mangrovibacterium sp.]